MTNILLTVQILGTAIIFLYILYVFSKKRAGEHTVLTAALIAAFINAFGYTMVILSENIDSAASVKAFDITGSALALYLLYLFVGDLCRVKIPVAVSIILLIGDITGIAAAASDRQLHFYYKNVVPVSDAGFFAAEVEYDFGFYILMASMIIQTIMIIFIAAYGCRKKRVAGSKHMMCVFLAVLLPSASMISYQFKLLGYFNPSSLVMGLTVITINIVILHCQKSDMVTSARDSIIETMDDALIVTDLKMQVIDSNPAARRIFPVISGGSKWKPDDAMKLVADLVNENKNTEFEIDGKYYEKHISRLYNSDGSAKGYSVLVLDVTETKKYVDQLIEMRKKADMANSAKSDFLANMSHEIRTPMNAITGFAELCLQEKNYTYASDIKTAAKNLISIINDILDISKIEAGKLELVPAVYNTEEMLNDVISIIYVQLGSKKNIDFKIDIDKRLPKKMFGDEVRIKQILINLLGNAVKFTKNGYIALSVKELSRDNDKISLMFKVSDTGIGIKKEDIPKLFENFQQVDTKKNREIEGSGLGLPISKTLAGMMDGSITVESEYGKGSVFKVVLVQTISDASPISKAAAKTTISEEKTTVIYAPDVHVLVVDDNKVNLDVTSHLLSVYGIKADLAESGRKAIDMINSGYYDLVFMDHMMPELDGVDTTKIIRSQKDAYSKELPIVALTANAVSGAREMFIESGFNDFISKPIQIPLLEKILETWLPKQMISYVERSRQNASNVSAGSEVFDIAGIGEAENPSEASSGEDAFLIPNVDVKAGLQLCGGNLNAYLAILKTFMETADEIISRIESTAQNRDYKNYTTEVHGLKSSAMAIGAKSLSDMAKSLEAAGKQENYKQIMYDTPMLIARYSDVVEHIKPFVETEKSSGTDKPPVDKELLRSKLNEVLEALDTLDSHEALKILDMLLEFGYDNKTVAEELESSRRNVDNFAYEKAEASVKHILEIV